MSVFISKLLINPLFWLIVIFIFICLVIRSVLKKDALMATVLVGVIACFGVIYTFVEKICIPIVDTGRLIDEITDSGNNSNVKVIPVNNDLVIEQLCESNAEIKSYPVGVYSLEEFPVAIEPLNKSCEVIRDYIKENDLSNVKIEIKIGGTADGIPSKNSRYIGDLGYVPNLRYFSLNDNEIKSISLIPQKTIMTNEVFAVARAYQIDRFCKSFFGDEYPLETELITFRYKERGPDYRKIILKITVRNAYDKYIKDMSLIEQESFMRINRYLNSE